MLNDDNSQETFLQKPKADKTFRLQISRNTLLAFLLSLLIHGLLLLIIKPISMQPEAVLPARELTVSLAPPTPKKTVTPKKIDTPKKIVTNDEDLSLSIPAPPTQPAIKPAKPLPKVMTQKPKKASKPPAFKVPDVLVNKDLKSEKTNQIVTEKASPNLSIPKETKTPASVINEAPTDMLAYVNGQRAAREANEADAAKQNREAAAREIGPSAEQLRDEKIKRNFENGTNGIFEITSLGNRQATFAFRGWTNDFSNSRKTFYEVEAKANQDVRLVMIKRMISLIRQHYTGDFNWESQRMGRTIIMSARVEDSAGLEEFMMTEFFGQNYKTTAN